LSLPLADSPVSPDRRNILLSGNGVISEFRKWGQFVFRCSRHRSFTTLPPDFEQHIATSARPAQHASSWMSPETTTFVRRLSEKTAEVSAFSRHRACLGRFRTSALPRMCSNQEMRRPETDRGEGTVDLWRPFQSRACPEAEFCMCDALTVFALNCTDPNCEETFLFPAPALYWAVAGDSQTA